MTIEPGRCGSKSTVVMSTASMPPGRVIVKTYRATGAAAGNAVTGPELTDLPFYVTAQCASPAASTTG